MKKEVEFLIQNLYQLSRCLDKAPNKIKWIVVTEHIPVPGYYDLQEERHLYRSVEDFVRSLFTTHIVGTFFSVEVE